MAAGSVWQRSHGPAHGQIASLDEISQASFDAAPVQQHVSVACPAAQPDVRAKPIHQPFTATAWVSPPQTNDIAETELDDFRLTGRHYCNS